MLPALVALGAGAVLPFALAPFDIAPLMLVAVGALFWTFRRAPSRRAAFVAGWLFGVGKYAVGASWIYVSIHVYGAASPPLAVFLVALFVAGLALFPALAGLAFSHLTSRSPRDSIWGDILLFSVLFAALEWLLTWFLTGFPWLFAGYAFIDTPLAGLAPVGGVLSMSLVVAFTAACAVGLPALSSARSRALAVGLPLALWLGAWALASVSWTEPGDARRVALVQADIPQESKWDRGRLADWKARYRDLTLPVRDADIVVWPEAAVPDYYHLARPFIDETAADLAGDLVQGTVLIEAGENPKSATVYNAAVSTGGGVYRKRRLVPFGDYVPFESVLRGLIGFFDLPMSSGTPATGPQPHLKAAGWRLAMAICYEIAYPRDVAGHARGADVLVTVSNDTWFGASIGPLQHAQMARMRAIENGKYLLRATNNGLTAIIDDQGVVIAALPQFEAGVLTGTVRATTGATPYGRFLDLPLLATLGAMMAGWLIGCRARRRSDPQGAASGA